MSVLVVGAGGHAKVVIATLQALGETVAGCVDDDPAAVGRRVLGVPVTGAVDAVATHQGGAVLAIGSNAARARLAAAFPDADWRTVVHPAAHVHLSVSLGRGTVVLAGAILQPDVEVGAYAILNTASTVDHDGRIGDFVHLAPGVHLSGGVIVEEGGFMGVGACAIPGVRIGAWGTVGAGGVVVRDLPPNVTSVGIPARPRTRP